MAIRALATVPSRPSCPAGSPDRPTQPVTGWCSRPERDSTGRRLDPSTRRARRHRRRVRAGFLATRGRTGDNGSSTRPCASHAAAPRSSGNRHHRGRHFTTGPSLVPSIKDADTREWQASRFRTLEVPIGQTVPTSAGLARVLLRPRGICGCGCGTQILGTGNDDLVTAERLCF